LSPAGASRRISERGRPKKKVRQRDKQRESKGKKSKRGFSCGKNSQGRNKPFRLKECRGKQGRCEKPSKSWDPWPSSGEKAKEISVDQREKKLKDHKFRRVWRRGEFGSEVPEKEGALWSRP